MISRARMLLLLSTALLLAAPIAMAQTISDLSGAGAPPVSIALSPTNPQPYGTAALSVTSSTLELANATLTVLVNGVQTYKGNVQPVAVTIGAPGSATTIKAVVTSQGQSYTQSLRIVPGDVSLVEEPLGTAPPLYAGKPLVPLSGQVRLVAIAGFRTGAGAPISSANLSYSWAQDGSVLTSASGIGKNVIVVNAPLQYRASSITVTVSTQDTGQAGSASVSLAPQEPSVRIYASDPLLGIRFDHALGGSFAITDTEASFYAAPYSFSLAGGGPLLAWFLNGASAGTGSTITLRPTGSGAGSGSLSLSASKQDAYENAAASVSLSFGAKAATNFFGL